MEGRQAKIVLVVTEDWYFLSHRLPLALAAQRAGYKVVVACRVGSGGEAITGHGMTLVPLSLRRRSKNPFREIAAIFELAKIYRREKPDIVHHVALKPVIYGTIAARMAGVGRVVNALTGLGHVFIADQGPVVLLRRIIKQVFRRLFRAARCRIIFQNPDDLQLFLQEKIVNSSQAVLIKGSGVDPEIYYPADQPVAEPKILMASRLLWDKGIGELVEASRLLKRQGIPVEVLLAGRIDADNPAAIPEATIQAWQDAGLIRWLGNVDDVAVLLRAVQIAVLPSYREGVPKSLLEAAAAGLPLVATDVPGCREIVTDRNGILVPPKDAASLAEALKTLLRDGNLRRRMGLASRNLACREFSVDKVNRETLEVYRLLLEESGENDAP